jgi:hypothetical protein
LDAIDAGGEPVGTVDPSAAGSSAEPSGAAAPPSFADNLESAAPSISKKDHDAALSAEKERALAEWREQHGWAEQVTPETRQWFNQTAARLQSDPVGYARDLLVFAAQHPQYRNQVAQLLGAVAPRQTAPAATAADDPEPEPDLQLPDGRLLYSATQQGKWREWHERKLEAKFADRFKPFEEMKSRVEQREQVQQAWQAATTQAHAMRGYVELLPGWTESKDEILRVYEAMRFETDEQARMGILAAYHHVVLPKLKAQAEIDRAADHARRAAASTTRPTGTQAAGTRATTQSFGSRLAERFREAEKAS